jgi:hypothetical protein
LLVLQATFASLSRSISFMRVHSSVGRPVTRFALWLATTSLTLSTPLSAIAQPAAPPGAAAQGQDVAGQANTDPPAIAGSLAAIAGSVSFHAAGETQWSPATLNYPVTNGEGFWTEPQASATIDVADDQVVLDESTEFDVTTLDNSQFVASEAQGAIFVQLKSLTQGQTLVVNTPRGSVQISQAGDYEIVAGDTNDATTVTVVQGAAHIAGTNLALDVGPNQTAAITGSDTLQGTVGALQEDAFLKTQLQLLAQQPQRSAATPPECRSMTGGEQLASYGSFTPSAQYGQVWYPRDVPSNWAPYRDGHWAYVSPWGWTWVDNARWGFAPFHYGRWAQIEGRWGWLPGGGAPYVPGSYPIYSPALVSFVGVGTVGLGFSLGIGGGGYAPAWIPLGPREPYYPWYHTREGYFGRINSFYGVPRDIINRGPTYINTVNFHQNNFFINRAAATVISPAAFARGQSVLTAGHALPERAFADARPLGGRLAVRPTAFTPNLPPEAARHFDVPLPARPLHAAAGPRIVPVAPGARAVPELRRVALPQNVHGVPAVARPGEPALRPGEAARPSEVGRPGLPPLRPGEAARPGEPQAGHSLPALREPGAHPEDLRRTGEPGARVPEVVARPGAPAARPDARGPEARGPEARGPEAARPEQAGRPGGITRPGEVGGPEARPGVRPEAAPHAESRAPVHTEPRALPHEAAPHASRPEVQRPAAARPEPREAARPPVHEAPRAEVHEAPRAAAHEAPRAAVHEAPRAEARPVPRPEAARPEPRHAEPARPAPRPAGHPEEKHEPHHH